MSGSTGEHPSAELRDARVVVTGASGLFGAALATALAATNEVVGVARFGDGAARAGLEAAGVRTVAFDLGDTDLAPLPETADVVFHCGAALPGIMTQAQMFDVNTQAVGRLMRRFRDAHAFVHCSSAAVYARKELGDYTEDDALGVDRHPNPDYPLTKIAAEQLVRFLSPEYGLPATILRIFALYGPGGGFPTQLIERVAAGKPLSLPPGPTEQNPMYETDFVEKAVAAAHAATVPPLIINFAGSERTTVETYTRLAGEVLGIPAQYGPVTAGFAPSPANMTAMTAAVGATRVSVEDGVRRVVEHLRSRPASS
jgi:UDP-glucuronate 4-epimerase